MTSQATLRVSFQIPHTSLTSPVRSHEGGQGEWGGGWRPWSPGWTVTCSGDGRHVEDLRPGLADIWRGR